MAGDMRGTGFRRTLVVGESVVGDVSTGSKEEKRSPHFRDLILLLLLLAIWLGVDGCRGSSGRPPLISCFTAR